MPTNLPQGDSAPRVVKRYSNRKLYDTKDSRYVTLPQIAVMVRDGQEVQIIDNTTKEDITEVTLAQIIYEEQKEKSRSVPLQTLRDLIHQRTEKVLADLREGPIGRLIPGAPKDGKGDAKEGEEEAEPVIPPAKPTSARLVDQAKGKIEDLQHTLDERAQAVLLSLRPFEQLRDDVRRLHDRLDALERQLADRDPR
jgi:polyhydroxyalkanoate synthesis repressor PhaR